MELVGWESTFYGKSLFRPKNQNYSNLFLALLAGAVIASQLEIGFAILTGNTGIFKHFVQRKVAKSAPKSPARMLPWPVEPTVTTTITGGLTRQQQHDLEQTQQHQEESARLPEDGLRIWVTTTITQTSSPNPDYVAGSSTAVNPRVIASSTNSRPRPRPRPGSAIELQELPVVVARRGRPRHSRGSRNGPAAPTEGDI